MPVESDGGPAERDLPDGGDGPERQEGLVDAEWARGLGREQGVGRVVGAVGPFGLGAGDGEGERGELGGARAPASSPAVVSLFFLAFAAAPPSRDL